MTTTTTTKTTNMLSTVNASNWIGDGTVGGVHLRVTNDTSNSDSDDRKTATTNSTTNDATTVTVITVSSAPHSGAPYTIRLDAPPPSPSPSPSLLVSTQNTSTVSYFEMTVRNMDTTRNTSLSLGYVTDTALQPGWKARGMFYNGLNVTNITALQIGAFGPRAIQAGDTIGVALHRKTEKTEEVIDTIFYFNQRCLGSGYHLVFQDGGTKDDGVIYYPSISITGKATLHYTAPNSIPLILERQPATFHKEDKYSGEWRVTQVAWTGPELPHRLVLPEPLLAELAAENNNITIHFAARGGTDNDASEENDANSASYYHVSIKVANRFQTSLTITGRTRENSDSECDTIEVGRVGATRMLPPPELAVWEVFMSTQFETLDKMRILLNTTTTNDTTTTTTTLIMTGPTAELHCQRYVQSFVPVTSYE